MLAIQAWFRRFNSGRTILQRGESAVAPMGFAVAVILLAAIGGTAWWSQRTQKAQVADTTFEQVRETGHLLRSSVEPLLVADDLSAVRRLVVQTAHGGNLTQCRIVLLDGQVLADADPSRITATAPGPTWPDGPEPADEESLSSGAIRLVHTLLVPGRGRARLELLAETRSEHSQAGRAQIGIALIATTALICLLLVYRHARSRLRALGEIREALAAIRDGESSLEAVKLTNRFGPEAQTWNDMLSETQKSRQMEIAERARQSLDTDRRSSGGLDAVCDVMSQGLLLMDDQLRTTYANGAAAIFLQTEHDQIVESSVEPHLPDPQLLELVRAAAGGSATRRGSVDLDLRGEEGGQRGVLRFNVRHLDGKQGVAAMLQIEDITQQRIAEDSRHSFAAQATHELRTPLTNIRLSVETMLDAPYDREVRSQCLNTINQEAHRLERVVAEMLSVAEIEAGSLTVASDDVPLETMLNELKSDYQAQADEKTIALKFDVPPKLPSLVGDRDKIMLALQNLVGNALKYTPDGNQVVVTVEQQDNELMVHVSDTGFGISEQDTERIFEKFYRARDERVHQITGSGLGLALAREVIRLHGGDITVQSQIDQGSTFTLTLPVQALAA